MAHLSDVMAYFCLHYPHKRELSKARLAKMVYLADWKSALQRNRQMTDVTWVFNHFGPYVSEVESIASSDPRFSVNRGTNAFGNPKTTISVDSNAREIGLDPGDIAILEHVIKVTQRLSWDQFIQLVYSTFPILTSERMSQLDLVGAARRYRNEVRAA